MVFCSGFSAMWCFPVCEHIGSYNLSCFVVVASAP